MSSSAATNTGCRRTTSRTTRNRWSPIARRRRTSACTSSRRSALATSVGSERSRWSSGSRRRWPPIARLERYHGHLYNWYDTRDLQRLEPEYVSTVDSGNLAGHLLAVANACRQMIDQPLPFGAVTAGIGDAVTLARESLGAVGDESGLRPMLDRLQEAVDAPACRAAAHPGRPGSASRNSVVAGSGPDRDRGVPRRPGRGCRRRGDDVGGCRSGDRQQPSPRHRGGDRRPRRRRAGRRRRAVDRRAVRPTRP